MSQHQQVDYAEMNRKFPGMVFNNQYNVAQKPQHAMYPAMNTMPPGMMPNIMPIPMMPAMQMGGPEMDYTGRWMMAPDPYQNVAFRGNGGQHYDMSHQQMQQSSVPNMSRASSLGSMGRISTSRSPTPSIDMCSSPRFGPGPPIVTSERVKGPRGCNLFVFHLPNEITNWDLYLLFRRFGTILSVHTMVNKSTGLSKGFGFVSYSDHQEAHAAISEMDGFRLGKKRLKVQLKRSQDDNPDGTHGDDEEDDDGSDIFYPSYSDQQQQQHHRQHHGGVAHQQQQLPMRNGSYNSFYADAPASGQTTGASTPTGGAKGCGNGVPHSASADAADGGGGEYFEGVNSATHSPESSAKHVAVSEDEEVARAFSKVSVSSRGGAAASADASSASIDTSGPLPPPPHQTPAAKPKGQQGSAHTPSKGAAPQKDRASAGRGGKGDPTGASQAAGAPNSSTK